MTPSKRDRAWLPVLFSAAVFPGTGQFIQRRFVSGTCFLLLFTLSILWVGKLLVYPAFHNLLVALDGMQDEFLLPDWSDIIIALPIAIGIYAASLVDTVWAGRK